jgi:hypothetical protein
MQGSLFGCDKDALESLVASIANCAAFGSVLTGEVQGISKQTCEEILASNGLLGTVDSIQNEMQSAGKITPRVPPEHRHWLFTSQQQRMSLIEMGVYDMHVAAAEETDEDFFGNFS